MESLNLRQQPRSRDNDTKEWRITLFRRAGIYPRTTVATSESLFDANDEVIFMVAPRIEWSEELPHSEVMWLNVGEIRLLGSLMMTERFDGGQRCNFQPIPLCRAYVDEFDPNDPSISNVVREALRDKIGQPEWARLMVGFEPDPQNLGGCFPADRLQIELQPLFFRAISTSNFVLLRGIYALIKSDMLALTYEFREEAIINTFIALDASFQLVVRHLKALGNKNPTARDAGQWLYETFDERLGLAYPEDYRYFEEFYDNRVQTLHPGSRLGDLPFAPLAWDDYSHLRSALPGILGYLATGLHTTEFEELFRQVELRQRTL
jgi:hypothetical protein